jgi:hypothetical protein
MFGGDAFGGLQVGDGSRDFQDAIVSTRGKPEPGDGIFQ